ncbi:putative uncharacterized protein DDB_G0286901 [Condylostylus longicornis]|uniref:putative uncharacterized protein DDB_G0286901 n=1 Tax=Condylostylus longicornis TaxID=2530218 RepID=UPI00244D99A5|nr:putative uncharacterized protein DDB_G0286901 [Condylostylus longicornis]
MSINIQQLILEAQKMANRNKELVALSNSLLVEAESNNRTLEAMRQFQDDIDSLNKLARNKSNSDMINRINQQNPSIRETRNENRELKATLEDHQRVLELVMQKYREHTQQNLFKSQVNFKELYNEKLLEVIRKQAEKINEMAAVMQKAAQADDDDIYKELEWNTKLKTENQALREILQIANDFGSTTPLCSGIVDVSSVCNNVIAASDAVGSSNDDIICIDEVKQNLLLHSQIATSSTSSGYGSSSIGTNSIQSSRILCRPCEDKAIQTEIIQQQHIDEQQQPQKLLELQQQSLHLSVNKSLENDDEDSVIENKQVNFIDDDNEQVVLSTMKIYNQVLENGNSNKTNIKSKLSTTEINSEQNSNNNSPNKNKQQPKIKQKEQQNLNNENNKNNLTASKQISENIKTIPVQQKTENNFVEITELSKLNLTNGTVDSIVENIESKQQLQINDTRLNNSTVKAEIQENNNKSTISS